MQDFEVETHYLDVGQGDCSVIVVRKKDKTIVRVVVFDCGSSSGSTAGTQLLNKCDELGIERIHVAIVSHFDKDHFNGFNELFDLANSRGNTRVEELFTETRFYTIGLIFKHYQLQLRNTSGKRKREEVVSIFRAKNNAKYPKSPKLLQSLEIYESFLTGIHRLSERNGLIHVTERVFSGFPDGQDVDMKEEVDFLVHEDEWKPTQVMDPISDFDQFMTVTFLRGDTNTILGQDLMNLDPNAPRIPVHLWCIAYNGNLLLDFKPHQNFMTEQGVLSLRSDGKKNAKIANGRSFGCVLMFQDYTAWFGGDLPTTHEDPLIESIQACMGKNKLSVLKASHHGAEESTSEEFIWALQPSQTIITCGRGVKSAQSPKKEGINGEDSIYGHPGILTMARLREWYEHLNEHQFDPGQSIFTTWVSRDRSLHDAGYIPYRMNEYFDEFGKDFTIITQGDITVYANPNGKVDYPTFEHFQTRFIPKKGSLIGAAFDQDDHEPIMRQVIKTISLKEDIPESELSYRFQLHPENAFEGDFEFYRSPKKRNRPEEIVYNISGEMELVNEKGEKRVRTTKRVQ